MFLTNGDLRIQFNGQTRSLAYQKGYQVPFTSSNPSIIIDFGRQILATSGNWGVILTPPSSVKHSLLWTQNISQDFIDGYNDNPSHNLSNILIGTNNSDWNWACDDNNPVGLSSLWNTAGYQWGSMIKKLTPRTKVFVGSANDIEAWPALDPNWIACGAGAELWFSGYETASPGAINYNFGDNPKDEPRGVDQWSSREVFDVIYGRDTALTYPEVYCTGSHWTTSWIPIRRDYTFVFSGVSSVNGTPGPPGCDNISWQSAWRNLDAALAKPSSTFNYPGYPNSVKSEVLAAWTNP